MKRIISILASLALTLSITACSDNENSSSQSDSLSSGNSSIEVITSATISNSENDETVTIGEINRIISTSASSTEILTGLGLGDKIIATDIYSADVEGIDPKVANLDMMNLDMEQLLALDPDVIFINEINLAGEADRYEALKNAGVNVIYIPAAKSIQDIINDILVISTYTSKVDEGNEMIDEINKTVYDIESKVALLSSNPPKVYLEVSPSPWLYSTGSGTFVDEIITICGGVNIYASQNSWLNNTEESVFEANPDIIITSVAFEGYDYNEIFARAGWENIKAVANNRVISVDSNSTSRASQNISKGIIEIAKAIHPELFN